MLPLLLSLFLHTDQPPLLWRCGPDVQTAHLQLLSQGLLGISLQEAVPWRAHLPLETQRRQAELKTVAELRNLT